MTSTQLLSAAVAFENEHPWVPQVIIVAQPIEATMNLQRGQAVIPLRLLSHGVDALLLHVASCTAVRILTENGSCAGASGSC